MCNIAGVVVIYNPEDRQEVEKNILSYLPHLGRLFMVDNSNQPAMDTMIFEDKGYTNIHYITNNANRGIAAALNQGAKAASDEQYQWLLTMDQDSFFQEPDITHYMEQVRSVLCNDTSVGIISPNHSRQINVPAFKEDVHAVTSGCIIQLNAWRQTGGFDERLFIDEVDADYNFKNSMAGYRMVQCSQVMLQHKLGEKKRTGLFNLFFVKERTIHNPLRIYYMVRNYKYIRKRYRKYFPEIYEWRDKEFLADLKNNLFFSGNFMKGTFYAVKGWMDYLNNKFYSISGKDNIS